MRLHCAPAVVAAVLISAIGCSTRPVATGDREARASTDDSRGRLPTGTRLDPAAPLHDVGQMPLAMIESPEGDRLVLLLNGWRDEGIQVIDRVRGTVLQTVQLPAAFLGLVFSTDGRTLYASGGNADVIYTFDWRNGAATLRDSIILQRRATPTANGVRYPAGIATSRDGRRLYVAENLADSLAVIDLATGRVTQRLATGRYPYGVAVAADGGVYVSNWGGQHVSAYASGSDGLRSAGQILVGRHPSALLLNARSNRLFVALASVDRVVSVDLDRRRVIGELADAPPSGPAEGSTPNALALSADGGRLFVAEADANAVAVFDLAPSTSGIAGSTGEDRLVGRIPSGWYPTAVLAHDDDVIVASAKGRGTRANPDGPGPVATPGRSQAIAKNTTLLQLSGTLMSAPLARADHATLEPYSARVALANGWTQPRGVALGYPPIEHVIYIVKENRTYDQVFGDLPRADGDTSLTLFPRRVTPNQHALAERFGIFDRFFVNAEVSPDGHNWSMAAYSTDYVAKTVYQNYSGRGRHYDYEGTQATSRGTVPDDDVASPARGYLWDLIERKGLTFRNYGEFVVPSGEDPDDVLPEGYRGTKPFLAAHTHPTYPGYDGGIPDQRRADIWLAEFAEFERRGVLPAMEIVRLPNDHTSALRAGAPTPAAMVADNDLALGRIIEALSKSRFWRSTAVFVLEDDAQNGPDHVDSHRSPMLVISPYVHAGVVHRFTNTTDVLRTMEELLGLDALSQFDYFGRPLRDIWSAEPVDRPFIALKPAVSLLEKNPAGTTGARESSRLDLRIEDVADEELFNRILWRSARPGVPYPGARRASSLEATRR